MQHIPRIKALLATLFFLYISQAQAATPLECATGSPVQNGGLDITAFIPNAPCMMAQITLTWGQWGLWTGLAKVGLTLTGAFMIYLAFIHLASGKPDKLAVPLVTAVIVSSILAPASRGQGLLPDLQVQAIQSFNDVYASAASVTNQSLTNGPNSVASQVEQLGVNIALLTARFRHSKTIMSQMWAINSGEVSGDLRDPTLVQNLYAKQIEKETEAANSVLGGGDWAFNVGFLLIYGLFAIFAGIIAAIGLSMQLTLLLAPFGLSLLVMQNWRPISYLAGGYLATLLTVAVLPITLSAVAVIGLSIPSQRLLPVVTTMNQDVAANLQQYQQILANGCGINVSCSIQQTVLIPMMNAYYSFKELLSGLFFVILAILIGLSISANLLRRVPANIAGMFGLSAGGESAGVETKAASRAFSMLGGAAALTSLKMAAAKTAAKTIKGRSGSAGDKKDGSGDVTSSESSSPAAGAANGVIPPVDASAKGTKTQDLNVPPSEATQPTQRARASDAKTNPAPRANPDSFETRGVTQPAKDLAGRTVANSATLRSRIINEDAGVSGPTFSEQYQAASGQEPLPQIQPARYADVAATRMNGLAPAPTPAPHQPVPTPVTRTMPASYVVQPTSGRVHAHDALSVKPTSPGTLTRPSTPPTPAPAPAPTPVQSTVPAENTPPRQAVYSVSRNVQGVQTGGFHPAPAPVHLFPAVTPGITAQATPVSTAPERWINRQNVPQPVTPLPPAPAKPAPAPAPQIEFDDVRQPAGDTTNATPAVSSPQRRRPGPSR